MMEILPQKGRSYQRGRCRRPKDTEGARVWSEEGTVWLYRQEGSLLVSLPGTRHHGLQSCRSEGLHASQKSAEGSKLDFFSVKPFVIIDLRLKAVLPLPARGTTPIAFHVWCPNPRIGIGQLHQFRHFSSRSSIFSQSNKHVSSSSSSFDPRLFRKRTFSHSHSLGSSFPGTSIAMQRPCHGDGGVDALAHQSDPQENFSSRYRCIS
jgi:hypothetical protein